MAGWLVFIIASAVYLLTMEPTGSFWDCGEFIASGYKLEVGHPPGAPFFMLMVRFFTMFAPSVKMVPIFANALSAIASGFTILFLFWTITHLARKIISADKLNLTQIILIISAGFVGSLAYTFSDTFWFSAVEGEVYATSSLFTALVFWAILKWEDNANSPYANRWLILIAYLMGLSIGVHLLNLLAIPAIVMVYYFKKYVITKWGIVKALLLSGVILIGIMYGVISGFVVFASKFELLFVNTFGLPYNSGVLFYIATIIALLIIGLRYTYKNKHTIFNTVLLAITVLLIGYGSYAVILIRASAKTPMNQNDPDNMFSLLYYLNREQYGERPLLYGQSFNAPVVEREEGGPYYIPENGKYIVAYKKFSYKFDSRFMSVFPRMYSNESQHVTAYKQWTNYRGIPISIRDENGKPEIRYVPKLSDNIKFFLKYQVGHMYLRYFMWNFAGRQNDLQGHGDIIKGNWVSGISAIDDARLGPQEALPDYLKNNKARNQYFFFPLLLGLAGLFFHFYKKQTDFWVVMLLFILTGLAIVVYLNQTPYQPRERDYAYAGSFYAFTIWIGLGVLALFELVKKAINNPVAAAGTGILCLILVPGIMAAENWDDHDRSKRYTSVDFGYNMLIGCEPNSVLFTYGDNDTFPLWYNQEVEGVRTDVRVSNLSYLRGDWYIDQMKRKAYESDPLPLSMTHDKYYSGKREVILIADRIKGAIPLDQAISFILSDHEMSQIVSPFNPSEKICFLPSTTLYIPIDKQNIINTSTVRPEKANDIVDTMIWKLNNEMILKEGFVVLDLLSTNKWNRPIYMGTTVSNESFQGLERYFQMEGLMYRIVPIETRKQQSRFSFGTADTQAMYENLLHKYRFRSIADPDVYLDENNSRIISNYRMIFARLAQKLVDEGQKDKAIESLDYCMKLIPAEKIPLNFFGLDLIESYYRADAPDKAVYYSKLMMDQSVGLIRFAVNLPNEKAKSLGSDLQMNMAYLQDLSRMAYLYEKGEHYKELESKFNEFKSILGN